jgi:hypothetical protein
MTKKNWLVALIIAWPLAAAAQSEAQLIERYSALAGSTQNATSLVTGLRDGEAVTLKLGTTTETFTPPTGKMGYGSIDNALALAEASLKNNGVTSPTPAQLETAVMEVLKLRADGQGWGRIAQTYGIKLGEVKPARIATVERPVRPEKPERPQRPERPERPSR